VSIVNALPSKFTRATQNKGAALLVDVLHAPHHPLPRGDRSRGAGGDVDRIKMMPATPLAAPEELSLGGEIAEPGPVDPVDECCALLIDHGRDPSRGDVDLHDPHRLVAALVVTEEE
jgi:hypothetical protein